MLKADIAVVGGGPAGYAAAVYAADAGAKVILVERDVLGGTCVNRGCVPTKILLQSAELANAIRSAAASGLSAKLGNIDLKKISARKQAVVGGFVDGIGELLRSKEIEVVIGDARLTGDHGIVVKAQDGSEQTIEAKNVILAPGAMSVRPEVPGLREEDLLTSEEVLGLEKVPESVLVIGGGPIGLEWAAFFNALGAEVTVAEPGAQVLNGEEQDVASIYQEMLEQSGVRVLLNASTTGAEKESDGAKLVSISRGETTEKVRVQQVLACGARVPRIDGLELDKVGVVTEGGAIRVNEKMETNKPGIYAAGDVVGGRMLSHLATEQGLVAAKNALGTRTRISYRAVPRCIYTMPQFASVGLTEEEARTKRGEVKTGIATLATSARAATIGKRDGVIKIVADGQHGDILGVTVVAPQASELIAQAVLAIKLEATVKDLASIFHAHPTLGESLAEAARSAV